VVELSVSQSLLDGGVPGGSGLEEAVRSLQSSLRLAMDDLSAEQEALQDALVVSHAHARAEIKAVTEQLATLVQQFRSDVSSMESAFAAATAEMTTVTTKAILTEFRDNWRSLRHQIAESAETVLIQGLERHAEISANLQAQHDQMVRELNRLARAQDIVERIRHDLQVSRDEEIMPTVQQLKTEAQTARDQLRTQEASLSWRLTRPLRALASNFQSK
jgi:hypothetical protein